MSASRKEKGNDGNGDITQGYLVEKEEIDRELEGIEVDSDDEEPLPENISFTNMEGVKPSKEDPAFLAFISAMLNAVYVVIFAGVSVDSGYTAVYEMSVGAVFLITVWYTIDYIIHNCYKQRKSGAKDDSGNDIYEDDPNWKTYFDTSISGYAV
jgi:hypothetical protein